MQILRSTLIGTILMDIAARYDALVMVVTSSPFPWWGGFLLGGHDNFVSLLCSLDGSVDYVGSNF
jgi:nucleotide-binding universal stress UspA family protein